MRITQSMITKSLLSSINQNRESMHSIQESITTGKRVERSSDDPVQFFRANRFHNCYHSSMYKKTDAPDEERHSGVNTAMNVVIIFAGGWLAAWLFFRFIQGRQRTIERGIDRGFR